MRVNGEAFLLINGWMNFLSLLLAACLGRCRFRMGKAVLAALPGAVYAVFAWQGSPNLRGVPALLGAAFLMAVFVFGRRGVRLFPLVLAAGWLLSGLSDFVQQRGAAPWLVLTMNGGLAGAFCLLTKYRTMESRKLYRLEIRWRGQTAVLSAMVDSGNLLRDGVTGLPVVVVPVSEARKLLPEGTNVGDLSTLPPGWRLIRAKTAAGSKTLMCFDPDKIIVGKGKTSKKIEAAVAFSDFQEIRALLPDCFFHREGEETFASL